MAATVSSLVIVPADGNILTEYLNIFLATETETTAGDPQVKDDKASDTSKGKEGKVFFFTYTSGVAVSLNIFLV